MKKILLLGIVALILFVGVGVLAYFLLFDADADWTTRSPAALEEFELGLLDLRRAARADAKARFERALELDPEFAAAQLFLAQVTPHRGHDAESMVATLEAVDLEPLSPRERYLIRHWIAVHRDDSIAAKEVIAEFLAELPNDLFAREAHCEATWEEQRYEEASTCYSDLIESHPNWLQGYDRLGKLSMAQGHFKKALEYFETYRYIAPDQTMPYVSLAQLLILVGRYPSAEEALTEALAIDSDACVVRSTLIRLYSLTGRFDEAWQAIDEMATLPACMDFQAVGAFCSKRASILYLEGDFDAAWQALTEDGCLERLSYDIIGHRVALATRRFEEAQKLRQALEDGVARAEERRQTTYRDWYLAALAHAEGVQLAHAGEHRAAAKELRKADELLYYWVGDLASFKLFNRQTLLYVLRMQDDRIGAARLAQEIQDVNPKLVREFVLPDMEVLGQRHAEATRTVLMTEQVK